MPKEARLSSRLYTIPCGYHVLLVLQICWNHIFFTANLFYNGWLTKISAVCFLSRIDQKTGSYQS